MCGGGYGGIDFPTYILNFLILNIHHLGREIEKPSLGPHPLFGLEEFRSEDELDALILFNADAMINMRTQALLIAERVLGCLNKETIFR